MKTISLINWCVLGIYALILAGLLIFSKPSGPDDRMATGYIMLLLVGLGILAAVNLLPYPFTRIAVLVLCVGPAVLALIMTIVSPVISRKNSINYQNERKARTDGSFYFQDTPRRELAAAIAAQDVDQCKIILDRGVTDLNKSGKENWTILDFAAIQFRNNRSPARFKILDLLLSKGALIDNRDRQHTPTHLQILDGDVSMLEWFLNNGADANAREAGTRAPILFKAVTGENSEPARPLKAERVRLLLEHGADPNADIPRQDELVIESSILMTAADLELWEICDMLLDHGADIHYVTPGGSTITDRVGYQLSQYRAWGKVPPEDLAGLAKRLNLPVSTDTPQ